MKTPVTVAPDALDFAGLIRPGETVGWAEATAEPVWLTRVLNAQAPRCPPFRVFFALTFGTEFSTDHPNVTVTAHMSADAVGWRESLAGQFAANVGHWLAGEPMINVVDKKLGYVSGAAGPATSSRGADR